MGNLLDKVNLFAFSTLPHLVAMASTDPIFWRGLAHQVRSLADLERSRQTPPACSSFSKSTYTHSFFFPGLNLLISVLSLVLGVSRLNHIDPLQYIQANQDHYNSFTPFPPHQQKLG